MADFGFVGPSYEAPSIYQDAQECINFRPEIDPLKQPGSRGVVALYPTPGLTTVVSFQNQAPVRGMRTLSGGQYMVAVCGQYVYLLSANLVPTIIGQLLTSTGQVSISDNGINVYIVDGANRYAWFINNPSSSAYLTGSISGTTLTVSQVKTGLITTGQSLFGLGVSAETVITGQLSGSTGGAGTYSVNNSQTVASTSMNSAASAAIFTGSMSGTTLTVTAVASGTLYPGLTITGSGVAANTIITALGNTIVLSESITTAGTGYAVNDTVVALGGVYGSNPATFVVTSIGSSGAVTGLTITNPGSYTQEPTNPVSTGTSGVGSGLTLNLTFGTGSGGTGTYAISTSQTVASETMYALNFTQLPVTDGAFQGGDVVDIVDNYFVYNRPNTQQWAASNLLSPITYSLSFASKDGAPDNLVSLIVDHREVYLLGERSSEVWVDVGTFPFAFQRIPGTSTQHGIAAKASVARLGNSFAYVSRNYRGQGQIMMMNGYIPQRISTHAVEYTLENQYIDDAIAWTYQLEGHEVYVVSFPTLDLTWAYDTASQMWHKWLWVDNNNVYHRHRGNCATTFQGMVLVGDWQNGQVYQLDPTNFTDNGQNIRRVRRAPHIVTDLQRQYLEELQIQFQPGVGFTGLSSPGISNAVYLGTPYTIKPTATLSIPGSAIDILGVNAAINSFTPTTKPQAMLRWSNDGGSTWSNEHWTTIGYEGKYKNRAIWRRLGWSRDRVFEVVVTDPVNAVIISANLKAQEGEN